jgi:hypothetical protein
VCPTPALLVSEKQSQLSQIESIVQAARWLDAAKRKHLDAELASRKLEIVIRTRRIETSTTISKKEFFASKGRKGGKPSDM